MRRKKSEENLEVVESGLEKVEDPKNIDGDKNNGNKKYTQKFTADEITKMRKKDQAETDRVRGKIAKL